VQCQGGRHFQHAIGVLLNSVRWVGSGVLLFVVIILQLCILALEEKDKVFCTFWFYRVDGEREVQRRVPLQKVCSGNSSKHGVDWWL
jgi:hypothetical protein